MKARNKSSSPAKRPVMVCPASGEVPYFDYDRSFKKRDAVTSELEQLRQRQKDLIINTCNKSGCGNCGLEWEEGGEKKCSSTELESRIMDLELN